MITLSKPSETLKSTFSPSNNSLTFIRFCLAAMVILSHSYDLGGFGDDPLKQYCGITIGEVAVNGFFAISGYLIVASFVTSRSTTRYIWKRLIRIFPGYWVCLLTTSLLLAPTLYVSKYNDYSAMSLFDNPFLEYVKANFWLRINQQSIHNIFSGNPADSVFNGSLWTLFPELLCYLFVIFLGKIGCFQKTRKTFVLTTFFVCLVINALSSHILLISEDLAFAGKIWYLLRLNILLVYFLAGASLFLFSHKIPLNNKTYYFSLFLLGFCILSKTYAFLGVLVFPYVLFCLAVKTPFSEFHQFGDYSYGLYLYAYPIQQTLFSMDVVLANPLHFFVLTTLLTSPLAWLSWNFVERYCLKMKSFNLSLG